jgi:hypothetical protein
LGYAENRAGTDVRCARDGVVWSSLDGVHVVSLDTAGRRDAPQCATEPNVHLSRDARRAIGGDYLVAKNDKNLLMVARDAVGRTRWSSLWPSLRGTYVKPRFDDSVRS